MINNGNNLVVCQAGYFIPFEILMVVEILCVSDLFFLYADRFLNFFHDCGVGDPDF